MYKKTEDKIQSLTIDFLRFPMAIAVIFIHMGPKVINLVDSDIDILSIKGLYNISGIMFSHVFSHISVPMFFLISGFLFFYNFNNERGYKNKLKSRISTLLIPYLLWNILPWLLYVLAIIFRNCLIGNSFSNLISFIETYNFNILYACHEWGESRVNWLGNNLLMTGPYNLPLWFLRDLIFMVILTPLINFLINKCKIWYIFFLLLAYVSRIWILIPGFHITACFFFSLGSYFAINQINIISFVRKYKMFAVISFLILLCLTVIYDGNNTFIGENIYPFFIITGVFAVFYITSNLIEKFDLKPNKLLISSCFFIYAFHGVVFPVINGSPLSFIEKIVHFIVPGESDIETLICYYITPFITAFLCIVLMLAIKKIFPRLAKVLTGNRS